MVAPARASSRRTPCQNWRADVSALLTASGGMVEWIKYSAYGTPTALPAGDTDSDGDWDATDSANITGSYDVRKDTNLDGVVSAADVTHANAITGTYQNLGRGVLSSPTVSNRRGYAGYEFDPTFAGAGGGGGGGRRIYHVRHRVYDADLGRWTRRDPLGYVDGMGLYEYVRSGPVGMTDPFGLFSQPSPTCAGSACSPPSPPPRPQQPRPPITCVGTVCQPPPPVPQACAKSWRVIGLQTCSKACRTMYRCRMSGHLGPPYSPAAELALKKCLQNCDIVFRGLPNIQECWRNLLKRGWLADRIDQQHVYLRCGEESAALNGPDEGKKGALPTPEPPKGRLLKTDCFPCYRVFGVVLPDSGGVLSDYATEEQIWKCITTRRMRRDYGAIKYNCQDWSHETQRACGIDCPNPGGPNHGRPD